MEQGTSVPAARNGGARQKLFVQAGQRIGRGVVIDPEIRIPYNVGRSKTARAARLLCDCGNEYVARIPPLIGRQPQVKSCGCLNREQTIAARTLGPASLRGKRAKNFIDRTGQRIGRLVVLREAQTDRSFGKHSIRWVCRCDCGTEVTVRATHLSRGNTRSCGCLGWSPRLPPGRSARNRLLKSYRQRARKRDLLWELSDDDFDRLTSQDCFYCGQPPSAVAACGLSEYTYNGIDRVTNSLGYTVGNTVSCCATCNNAKKDLPYDDFMAWIARLVQHNFFNPGLMPSVTLKAAEKPALRVVKDGGVA